ncbi:MAG: zinc ribbon domain-containing protein [Candidatus Caldarchaeum sp.]
MAKTKIGLALGAIGVAVVLLPVLLLFITGGFDSPIQKLYDTPLAPGLPFGIIITAAGGVVSCVGLLLFIKGMRAPPDYSRPPPAPRRPLKRAPPPSDLAVVERELEAMLSEDKPAIEVRTVEPRRIQNQQAAAQVQVEEAKPMASAERVKVVTRGVDEVCKTCGALNVLGARVCSQCGGELYKPDPKALPCPVCGAPVDESMKIGENVVCTVCFSELRIAQA